MHKKYMHSLILFPGCGTLFKVQRKWPFLQSFRNCSTDFSLFGCQLNYCERDLVFPCGVCIVLCIAQCFIAIIYCPRNTGKWISAIFLEHKLESSTEGSHNLLKPTEKPTEKDIEDVRGTGDPVC